MINLRIEILKVRDATLNTARMHELLLISLSSRYDF
jgi:hypothetical protein